MIARWGSKLLGMVHVSPIAQSKHILVNIYISKHDTTQNTLKVIYVFYVGGGLQSHPSQSKALNYQSIK
jgi:hypothetical protein